MFERYDAGFVGMFGQGGCGGEDCGVGGGKVGGGEGEMDL